MKYLWTMVGLVCLLSCCDPVRADLILTVVSTYPAIPGRAKSRISKVTYYVRGERIRTNLSDYYVIIDLKKKLNIVIDQQQHTYLITPYKDFMKEITSTFTHRDAKLTVHDTKKESVILDHKVRHYIVTLRQEPKIMNTFDVYATHDLGKNDTDWASLLYGQRAALIIKGTTLRMTTAFVRDHPSWVQEVTQVSTQEVPQSIFEIPKGYKKVNW